MTAEGSFKDRGNTAYQNGDYNKAIDLYTEGIENETTNAVLFSNRSAAYLNLGLYDKAKRDAEMCIQLDEKWPKGWWRKGTSQMESQEYKAARSTFNEGLAHCPGDGNLMAGIEKANKYIAAVEAVQGPAEAEFNVDAPRERPVEPIDESSPPLAGHEQTTENQQQSEEQSSTTKTKRQPKEDEPWPGTAGDEIDRIKSAPNHYAVLHVSTDATSAQMKKNYYTLARMLHPDRCQLEGAGEAMTSVSLAYDTLSNVLKKTLYDQFLQQTGGEQDEPNQTYQEWESRQQPVEIPRWLSFVLGIRGCGYVVIAATCLVLIPLFIIVFIFYFIITLLCLPVSCFFRVVFPDKYARMKEREEREVAKMEENAQDRMFAHV